MKVTSYLLLLTVLISVFASCSRKKDTFINRNWHAMTSRYNTLFNGEQALIQGEKELEQTFVDNYWNILPVERLVIEETFAIETEPKNKNFEYAEDKATKAIQKHSMNIDGEEVNPQMDEAFIMLGKARYFGGRYIPAQEAFNYVLRRYPTSDGITEARVWKAKVNIRLDNVEVAKNNLKEILEESRKFDLDDQDVAEAAAMLSEAYIQLNHLDSAIVPITLAAQTINDDEKKARYTFIKGQIYNRLGEFDKANAAFDNVIAMNRSIPRRYLINAYVEKARNFDLEQGDRVAFEELLAKLESYYENEPYLDRIYLLMADYYLQTDSTDLAVAYYNKSLRTNSSDKYLRSRNYLTLANLNFDNAEYKEAGDYFDSTLVNLDNTTREFRQITKRRENLDDVILYEGIARANDSILNIASLSAQDRFDYYQTYTNELKATAVAELKADNISPANTSGANEFYNKQRSTASGISGPKANANFYFYNPTTVAYGKQEFTRVWGNRELEDNWRTGGELFATNEASKKGIDPIAALDNDPRFNPQTYIDQIPTEQVVLDSLNTDRNFAYYQLGIIYKEKFKEYKLAADKLETLLDNNPEERLILPAKYNLYKIYQITGDTANENRIKTDILTNHPESRYAAIIKNPEALKNDANSPEAVYAQLYKAYENQNYAIVLEDVETYIQRYTGDPIVPKFELLKAYAEGRYLGFEAYKDGLNYVALNYPQSEEGKLAAKLYAESIPRIASSEFVPDAVEGKFKLVYTFDKNTDTNILEVKETLDRAIEKYGLRSAYTSIDVYNPFKSFLVLHGLQSRQAAEGLGNRIKEDKELKVNQSYFGISSENYTIIQIHKNLDAYFEAQIN